MRPPHAAFTLLELLVASVVTLIVVGLMLQLSSSSAAIWRRSEERTDTRREARAALERLQRDLETTARFTAAPTLRIGYDPVAPATDRVFEELYAIVSIPNAGKSDLCTVGYRAQWDAKAGCYVLLRGWRESNATHALLVPATGNSTPASPLSRDGMVEEPLARYIWDLTFRPCVGTNAATAYPDTLYGPQLPAVIEIRFKALGAIGIERLGGHTLTPAIWSNPADPLYQSHIAPYAESWSLRVQLLAGDRH